jgi:hypothetical protein
MHFARVLATALGVMKKMRNFIALCVASLCGCQHVASTERGSNAGPLVIVERLGAREFRLVNHTNESLQHVHWFGQNPDPVPYCKYSDGSESICSRKVLVDADDRLSIHEAYLAPGASVKFRAQFRDAIAVGVSVWLGSKQQYLWHTL